MEAGNCRHSTQPMAQWTLAWSPEDGILPLQNGLMVFRSKNARSREFLPFSLVHTHAPPNKSGENRRTGVSTGAAEGP
jgi:hypothetical protein